MNQKKSALVLVVDDEPGVEMIFSRILADLNYDYKYCGSVEDALPLLKNGLSPDVIFLDIRLPGMDGVSALPKFLGINPFARIIMMTAYQTVESVVNAMKSGAVDYLNKPLNPQMIGEALKKYGDSQSSLLPSHRMGKTKIGNGKESDSNKYHFSSFIAHTSTMKDVLGVADKFAASDGAVLLLGESGTGKEMLANYIHQKSTWASGPFMAVDCASIPEALFESELFGYEKGAFTGADSSKVGRFELASNGTLFLDEIGNVPIGLQAKLLRFIETHNLSRLGGKKTFQLNLRLVAATNENLQKAVEKGLFREDLYYRLSALMIHLPPLRNRPREEKEFLIQSFLQKNAQSLAKKIPKISDALMHVIMTYPWPGNVRELENAIYSASLLCDSDQLEITHLPIGVQSYVSGKGSERSPLMDVHQIQEKTLREVLEKVEREQILSTLKKTNGNKKKASEILDMDYKNLLTKLKKYGYAED